MYSKRNCMRIIFGDLEGFLEKLKHVHDLGRLKTK